MEVSRVTGVGQTQTSPRPDSSGPAGIPGEGLGGCPVSTLRVSLGVMSYRREEGLAGILGPQLEPPPLESPLARTAICVCRQAGPLLQGLLLPVPAAMAAVVVVGGSLAGWSAVQGHVAEMSHVGPLGCQCGDGALHGAGLWGWLWTGTRVGSQPESGVQPPGSSQAMGAGRPQDTSHREEWTWGSIPEAGVSPQTGQAERPGRWGQGGRIVPRRAWPGEDHCGAGVQGPQGPSLSLEYSSPPEIHPFFKSMLCTSCHLCVCLSQAR